MRSERFMASVTRWTARLAVAAVITAGGLSPALAAEFKVGSWVGHDVIKDGKVRGCEIYSPYPNGQATTGGASCREKSVQYEYITVVAGSLKNKEIITNNKKTLKYTYNII